MIILPDKLHTQDSKVDSILPVKKLSFGGKVLKFLKRLTYVFLVLAPRDLFKAFIKSKLFHFLVGYSLLKLIVPLVMKFFGDTMPAWIKWWLWPFMLLPFCIVISGCSSTQQKPADIGTGTDDLKQSICASCKGKPFYQNGQWLINH